jgi:hypothetical protein
LSKSATSIPTYSEFELTCRDYDIPETLQESIYNKMIDIEKESKIPSLFQIEIANNTYSIEKGDLSVPF